MSMLLLRSLTFQKMRIRHWPTQPRNFLDCVDYAVWARGVKIHTQRCFVFCISLRPYGIYDISYPDYNKMA